jgi:hypothetical protein
VVGFFFLVGFGAAVFRVAAMVRRMYGGNGLGGLVGRLQTQNRFILDCIEDESESISDQIVSRNSFTKYSYPNDCSPLLYFLCLGPAKSGTGAEKYQRKPRQKNRSAHKANARPPFFTFGEKSWQALLLCPLIELDCPHLKMLQISCH